MKGIDMKKFLLLLSASLVAAPTYWINKSTFSDGRSSPPLALSRMDTISTSPWVDSGTALAIVHDTAQALRGEMASGGLDTAHVTALIHDTSLVIRGLIAAGGLDSAHVRSIVHDSMVVERHQDTITSRGIVHDTSVILQTLISGKEPVIYGGYPSQFWSWDKTFRSITYSHLTGTVPTWNQNTTGTARFADSSRAAGIADTAKKAGTATKWATARNLTIGSSTQAIDGTMALTYSLAAIGAQPAGSYQPLENQRLSTSNSVTFAGIRLGASSYFRTGPSGDATIYNDGSNIYWGSVGVSRGMIFQDAGTNVLTWSAGGDPHFARPLSSGSAGMASWVGDASAGFWGLPADNLAIGWAGMIRQGNSLFFQPQSGGRINLATPEGVLRSDASGWLSSAALAVSDLPSSIQTAQSLPAGQVAIGNGSSGLTSSL